MFLAASIGLIFVAATCSHPPKNAAGEQRTSKVSAYLFDAELRRAGKPTSFRLEIFRGDSLLALSGRGYLGKGALRGRVTPDSLICYFPSSNEYLEESSLNLLHALECEVAPQSVDLVQLLEQLPDSALTDSTLKVVGNYQDIRQPQFIIYVENCPWQLELGYRLESSGRYHMDSFVFFDGKETRLKANCREYKSAASLDPSRFQVRIPSDAQRITP